jgi:hypothetical protein
MNDWGLPDWRDPSSYRETSEWSDLRWRWEFLRRRDDLRRDFDRYAPDAVALRNADFVKLDLPELRDQIASPDFTTAPFGGQPYGYEGIPNPRISALPDAFLAFLTTAQPSGGLHPYYAEGAVPVYPDGVQFSPDQAVWVFDLDWNIDLQLAIAREQLVRLQANREHRKGSKDHKAKWPTYLRVLDAKEAGASLTEIAAILPDSYARRDAQTAHNVIQQAIALQLRK